MFSQHGHYHPDITPRLPRGWVRPMPTLSSLHDGCASRRPSSPLRRTTRSAARLSAAVLAVRGGGYSEFAHAHVLVGGSSWEGGELGVDEGERFASVTRAVGTRSTLQYEGVWPWGLVGCGKGQVQYAAARVWT